MKKRIVLLLILFVAIVLGYYGLAASEKQEILVSFDSLSANPMDIQEMLMLAYNQDAEVTFYFIDKDMVAVEGMNFQADIVYVLDKNYRIKVLNDEIENIKISEELTYEALGFRGCEGEFVRIGDKSYCISKVVSPEIFEPFKSKYIGDKFICINNFSKDKIENLFWVISIKGKAAVVNAMIDTKFKGVNIEKSSIDIEKKIGIVVILILIFAVLCVDFLLQIVRRF